MSTHAGPFDLAMAIFSASLLGSLHCVGMCGPFVAIATAASPTTDVPRSFQINLIAYHLGRLTTYLALAGLGAIAIGSLGLQKIGAENYAFINWGGLIGGVLLCLGAWRGISLWTSHPVATGNTHPIATGNTHGWLYRWSFTVVKIRKMLPRSSPPWNAFFWGLTSTWLPCGWMYLFLLASFAAPTPWETILMMSAFWVGTLPLLTLTAWSWNRVGERWRSFSGPISTATILGMGIYLVATRSIHDTRQWAPWLSQRSVAPVPRSLISTDTSSEDVGVRLLKDLTQKLNDGLPCCTPGSKELEKTSP